MLPYRAGACHPRGIAVPTEGFGGATPWIAEDQLEESTGNDMEELAAPASELASPHLGDRRLLPPAPPSIPAPPVSSTPGSPRIKTRATPSAPTSLHFEVAMPPPSLTCTELCCGSPRVDAERLMPAIEAMPTVPSDDPLIEAVRSPGVRPLPSLGAVVAGVDTAVEVGG